MVFVARDAALRAGDAAAPPIADEIGIEDFLKVDLRVARIIAANDNPASAPRGQSSDATITPIAATDTSGPKTMAGPKLSQRITRGASNAPATMPPR